MSRAHGGCIWIINDKVGSWPWFGEKPNVKFQAMLARVKELDNVQIHKNIFSPAVLCYPSVVQTESL